MATFQLIMKWHYQYDKEGTWLDEDDGEERYDIRESAVFPLPHIRDKSLEIRDVNTDGDRITVGLYADHHTFTVQSDGEAVTAFVHDDYMVCGDSVSQTLRLVFSVNAMGNAPIES